MPKPAVVRRRKPVSHRVTAKARAPEQAAPGQTAPATPEEFEKLLAKFNEMLGRTQSGRALTKWG